MARYLCVVSRERPDLYGYLVVAYRRMRPGADEVSVVIDRRRADPSGNPTAFRRPERRRAPAPHPGLHRRGYAIMPASGRSAGLPARPRSSPAARRRSGRGGRNVLSRGAALLALLAAAAAVYLATPEHLAGAVSSARAWGAAVLGTLSPRAPGDGERRGEAAPPPT